MFKITVTEVVAEKTIEGKDWEIKSKPKEGDSVYGYTPEIEKTTVVTKEVYKQSVDKLDIVALIAAVNKE